MNNSAFTLLYNSFVDICLHFAWVNIMSEIITSCQRNKFKFIRNWQIEFQLVLRFYIPSIGVSIYHSTMQKPGNYHVYNSHIIQIAPVLQALVFVCVWFHAILSHVCIHIATSSITTQSCCITTKDFPHAIPSYPYYIAILILSLVANSCQ